MPTINLTSYHAKGHVYDFFEKLKNFGVLNGLTEHKIIGLLFTYLKGTTADWFTAEVEASPPVNREQGMGMFSA